MDNLIIIKPKNGLVNLNLKELWRYRELLYFLSWRDLKVRYKQTFIGVLWAILKPFITMVVFSVFFGGLAKIPSDNVPYPIFVFVGLLLWDFFSTSLSQISNSLVENKSIITKVYFPRLILPVSSILTGLVDFLIALAILVGLMFYYHYVPSLLGVLILPLLLLITFIAALGLGLFLSAINVKYRDVRYILPFFIQMLLFVTPVIYPASILKNHAWLLAINPLTGVIDAARASILGTGSINWLFMAISFVISLGLFIFGLIYFKRTEKYFADVI